MGIEGQAVGNRTLESRSLSDFLHWHYIQATTRAQIPAVPLMPIGWAGHYKHFSFAGYITGISWISLNALFMLGISLLPPNWATISSSPTGDNDSSTYMTSVARLAADLCYSYSGSLKLSTMTSVSKYHASRENTETVEVAVGWMSFQKVSYVHACFPRLPF